MRRNWTGMAAVTAAAVLVAGSAGLTAAPQAPKPPAQAAAAAGGPTAKPSPAAVARGKYLVTATGCNDCHTPSKMGANGPEPDMALMLSGHPASMTLPPPPAPSGPWIVSTSASTTAFAGPWGISYTRNLTPDPESGLGQWTEQQFIDTIRTGREQGRGRELLPPMPWPMYKNFNDADLKAIFAYLRSIPAIKNKVPDPVLAAPPK
ncbi:MAG: c-type cytochrome [Acidobacteriota bacterium]